MKSNTFSDDASKALVALFAVFVAIVLSELVTGTLSITRTFLMGGIVVGFALCFIFPLRGR